MSFRNVALCSIDGIEKRRDPLRGRGRDVVVLHLVSRLYAHVLMPVFLRLCTMS